MKILRGLTVGLLLMLGVSVAGHADSEHRDIALKMGHADLGSPFTLVDANGNSVTDKDFRGKLVLIYFGYTQCLMQCPPSWINLDKVMRGLGSDRGKVAAVFISIDPARDTVARIAEWQKNWETITALTGAKEQIHDVTAKFHVFYARKPDHAMSYAMKEMQRILAAYGSNRRIDWKKSKPADYYMMDHTTQTFLLA